MGPKTVDSALCPLVSGGTRGLIMLDMEFILNLTLSRVGGIIKKFGLLPQTGGGRIFFFLPPALLAVSNFAFDGGVK